MALNIYSTQENKTQLNIILELYGDFLSSKGKFNEAGLCIYMIINNNYFSIL